MTNKTTEKHHLYYQTLAEKVSDREITEFLKKNELTPTLIKQEYKKDKFFRFMNFEIFDNNIHSSAWCEPELAQTINSCLWKWIFVFRILKAKPIFVGSSNYFSIVGV